MKEAKKFETNMDVPSAKTHSVLTPFGCVLTTLRWQMFGSGLVLSWIATSISPRTVAPAKRFAKQVGITS